MDDVNAIQTDHSGRGGERGELAAPGVLEAEVAEAPPVLISADHLAEVFSALLDNALAYRSPDRPLRIRITAGRSADRVVVTTDDNGIGIPPEYRVRVFGIFERLAPDNGPGTGIGLALARKVIETAGGRIWVDEPETIGTRIRFELPTKHQPGQAGGAAPVEPAAVRALTPSPAPT